MRAVSSLPMNDSSQMPLIFARAGLNRLAIQLKNIMNDYCVQYKYRRHMCGICRAVHAEDAEVTGLGQAVPSSRAEEDEEKLHGGGDLPNGGGGNASAQRNRTSRKRQSRVSVKVNVYTFSTLTRSLLPSGCRDPPCLIWRGIG